MMPTDETQVAQLLAETFCMTRIENSVYTRILGNAYGNLVHKFLEMSFFFRNL